MEEAVTKCIVVGTLIMVMAPVIRSSDNVDNCYDRYDCFDYRYDYHQLQRSV